MSKPTSTTALQPDRTRFAMLMALFGVFVITFNDFATKWISTDISLWQLQFMRSLFALLLLLPPLVLMGKLRMLQVINRKAVLIRCSIMSLTYLAFFAALAAMPLAEVAGSFFTGPMFMVLLSWLMLQERAGVWRIGSVIIGFIGVLLILRPDSGEFSLMSLLPVTAGFFYALTQVYTRKYCKQEDPLALSVWLTVCFMLVGLCGMIVLAFVPAATGDAHFLNYPLTATTWLPTLIIAGIAICSLIMHFALATAYQNAPASLIGPLEYIYLPLAILGGYLLFDEIPQPSAVLGIVIIIGAGLIIAWRERHL